MDRYGYATGSHRSPTGEARKSTLNCIPKTFGQFPALVGKEREA